MMLRRSKIIFTGIISLVSLVACTTNLITNPLPTFGTSGAAEFYLVQDNWARSDGAFVYDRIESSEHYLHTEMMLGPRDITQSRIATSPYGWHAIEITFNNAANQKIDRLANDYPDRLIALAYQDRVWTTFPITTLQTPGSVMVIDALDLLSAQSLLAGLSYNP